MHLKRLEIQGFKTFAAPTVLEFRPGITAIVGPNGSGKSNIADAIRWVLGEQSYTALRCKRSEELLFSGSERRQPAALAEVSLTIDNSDGVLPLDYQEVTITRRINRPRDNRSGDNEYLLNHARVRLRDVQEATEPLGSSYTIINQGLVDMALTLRPEERRRLFEHAAELGGFEMRRADAERRLAETEANMQRVADLLSELEPRLRSLKRQATQARQYHEVAAELQHMLLLHYAAQWHALQAEMAAAQERLASMRAELEQSRAGRAAATANLQTLAESLQEQREQLTFLQQQSRAVQARDETAQRELSRSHDRLAALQQRMAELEQSSGEIDQSHAQAHDEYAAAAAALAAAETELNTQRARLSDCEQEAATSEAARHAAENELTQAREAASHAASTASEQRSRIEHLAAQRERLTQDQTRLDELQRQAATQAAAAQQQVAVAQDALVAAEQEHQAAAQAEEAARANLDQLRHERANAGDALAAARRALADVQARLDSLSHLARSYSGTFPGVKAAMQWAERSGRTGFALVSSVVRVPGELETAIEIALGARLQHIVVESWQDAEDAIAELKRSRAGRATFLPLDSLRRSESRPPRLRSADPEAVPGVAADLVDYDPHYRDVVAYLLGRTLIVRDLPTARNELQGLPGGWNIVTLAGEQVSSGGAVTGGTQTRDAGTLQRERELRELPQQVEQAQAVQAAAEEHCRVLDERLALAQQTMREAETHHHEANRHYTQQQHALESAAQRATQADQEQTWRRERCEVVARDLETLATQEADLLAQLGEADARAAAAQEHLDVLRARHEADAHSDRALQERLAAQRSAAATAEANVEACRTLAAAHRQTLERLERQQAEMVPRRAVVQAEHDQLERICHQTTAACVALQAEQETLQAQLAPLAEALRQETARQSELEQQEKQAAAALLEQESACNRADLDMQRAQDRLDNLRARAEADGLELETLHGEHSPADAPPDLPAEIDQLRERLRRFGTVNPLAPQEYDEAAQHHTFTQTQLSDLDQAKTTLRELISELETAMHNRFLQTFQAVAKEFERYFTRLFGGGTARLQLVSGGKSSDNGTGATTEAVGIEIIARPPGKRQQNLSLLSGGERALTASALLFAILSVNPSPFCILDEVDAALDESNVGRFRDALGDLTHRTQFILISHNRGTIEAADTLYGVTMGDDSISKVLSLRLETVGEYVS